MIFWKRRQHRLPKFPSNVIPTFKRLCEELPVEMLDDLRAAVDHCLVELRGMLEKHPHLNLRLAEQIGDRCYLLIDNYPELDSKQRELVIGAIRYFAIAEDPYSEETFASGLIDDAKIVNYVLEELELFDSYLEY